MFKIIEEFKRIFHCRNDNEETMYKHICMYAQ